MLSKCQRKPEEDQFVGARAKGHPRKITIVEQRTKKTTSQRDRTARTKRRSDTLAIHS